MSINPCQSRRVIPGSDLTCVANRILEAPGSAWIGIPALEGRATRVAAHRLSQHPRRLRLVHRHGRGRSRTDVCVTAKTGSLKSDVIVRKTDVCNHMAVGG